MHETTEWLKPSDRPIIAHLTEYPEWVKPATAALNIQYSQQHVARRCRTLWEHELLDRYGEDMPAYRLTEKGQEFLNDNLDAADLRE